MKEIIIKKELIPDINFILKENNIIEIFDIKNNLTIVFFEYKLDLGLKLIVFSGLKNINGIKCSGLKINDIFEEVKRNYVRTINFYIDKSWETGIEHLVLLNNSADKINYLDKEDFNYLVKEFGLFYHKYDSQFEERFNAWAIRTTYFTKEESEEYKKSNSGLPLSKTKWYKTNEIKEKVSNYLKSKGYNCVIS